MHKNTYTDQVFVFGVFPTYVGMNRNMLNYKLKLQRVPHIRGDEPYRISLAVVLARCSPHTWG